MNLGLDGKRVLITGSTRGIGLAAARAFLAEGARVFLNGTNKERLDEAVDELGKHGPDIRGGVADVSKESEVEGLFAQMDREFGGLDVLVNNAAVHHRATFMELSEETWDRELDVNLKSVFLCSRKAVRRMMKQEGGVILNASSFAAIIPGFATGVYAASKAAIVNITRSMAAEFAPYRIRVNAYIPGLIDTDMNREQLRRNGDAVRAAISLNREGQPEEIAAPLVFLASGKAAYITGAFLEISGGKFAVQNPADAWRH